MISGVVLVAKPAGPTSHDVVDVVRHALVQRIVRAYESAKPQQQELPLSIGEGMTVEQAPQQVQAPKPQ